MRLTLRKHINLIQIRTALLILEYVPALAPGGKRDLNDLHGRRTPDLELVEAQRSLRWVIRQIVRKEH